MKRLLSSRAITRRKFIKSILVGIATLTILPVILKKFGWNKSRAFVKSIINTKKQ